MACSSLPDLPAGLRDRPVAHRALHGPGVPENSRAAITAAVVAGYPAEIDLQCSADAVAVVFHDATLDRLTGASGATGARSAAALGALALDGTAQTILTLAQVLALVAGRVPLLIELKDQTGTLGPGPGTLETATARALAGYPGPVAVMSFNPHSMLDMARLAPDVARGLVTCAFAAADWPGVPPARRRALAEMAGFDRAGCSFISHDRRALDAPAVAALRARGTPVLCWTVRSPAQERAARRLADNITFEGYLPRSAPGTS